MKTKWLTSTLVLVIALLFAAPPCWAKAKGYFFVIGYSYKLKKTYCSNIFVVEVRDVSYSDTEYVAEVALLEKMEAQFKTTLANRARQNPDDFTVAGRGAYKSENLALARLNKEKERYKKRKFEIVDLKGFQFKE